MSGWETEGDLFLLLIKIKVLKLQTAEAAILVQLRQIYQTPSSNYNPIS
jgi:hypothetical protein